MQEKQLPNHLVVATLLCCVHLTNIQSLSALFLVSSNSCEKDLTLLTPLSQTNICLVLCCFALLVYRTFAVRTAAWGLKWHNESCERNQTVVLDSLINWVTPHYYLTFLSSYTAYFSLLFTFCTKDTDLSQLSEYRCGWFMMAWLHFAIRGSHKGREHTKTNKGTFSNLVLSQKTKISAMNKKIYFLVYFFFATSHLATSLMQPSGETKIRGRGEEMGEGAGQNNDIVNSVCHDGVK